MFANSRRQFLGGTVAAAATAALTRPVFGAAENRTLRLGVIGVGWWAMTDVQAALKAGGVEIAALCDVDSSRLKQNADQLEKRQGKRPQTFKLYQELLDVKGLDAVIIATPPHWHALTFIAALEHGLDVYCEKPLAYDIREGEAMAAAAARHGRIVQIGFQRRQSNAFAAVKKLIQSGEAGRIVQADAQIHYRADLKSPAPQTPPDTLDLTSGAGRDPRFPTAPRSAT